MTVGLKILSARLSIVLLLLGVFSDASAAVYRIKGVVVDSISGETVPYAAITPLGTFTKALADADGHFLVNTPRSFTQVEVSAMGFTPKTIDLKGLDANNLTVRLHSSGVALGEVIAKPGKERYSKRNNPAVAFANRIKEGGEKTDPMLKPYYSFDRYERITLALNNVKDDDAVFKAFPELKQYVDTSEVSGNPILNVSVKEKVSDVHYRNSPKAEKTYVTGINRRGIDESFDQQSIQTLLEDVLREVDVYDNDVNILQNRFVSPLSRIAPDFYKFYLSDTLRVDTTEFIVLSFVPRTPQSFGFTGRIYVESGDTTMMIRRLEMNVPHDINLNFISHLYINQEYDRAPDGSRLKKRDDMTIELNVFGMQFYTRRNTAYTNHSFEAPADETLFDGLQKVIEIPGAEVQTDEFWEEHRLIPIPKQEDGMGIMVDNLRKNKFYYWAEKIILTIAAGYIQTGNPSKFDFGPVNTLISGNPLEGVRLRVGGLTTASLSPRWFMKGYVAWGTADKEWKYMAEVEHSFHDKKVHPREFPVHSIALTSKRDVDMLGQHYLFTNPDNVFLTLKRKKDKMISYLWSNTLTYTLELHNNFSVKASVGSHTQISSRLLKFRDGLGRYFSHYNEASATVQLRYAPGEKFFQTRSQRLPVNLDAPIFILSHTYAPRGFAGNLYEVNRTELSVQKRWWLSAFGYLDMIVKGGHVWSKSGYPDLLIPNANLSYTIQPESYALLNPMEFINDSFASWDLTYWANGALFNLVPVLKKAKLREVIGFRGFWGHLSRKNRPWLDPSLLSFPAEADTRLMTGMPYMEISAGIENIFKVLRIDYVWRLTYRSAPGISRHGPRIALHITF